MFAPLHINSHEDKRVWCVGKELKTLQCLGVGTCTDSPADGSCRRREISGEIRLDEECDDAEEGVTDRPFLKIGGGGLGSFLNFRLS